MLNVYKTNWTRCIFKLTIPKRSFGLWALIFIIYITKAKCMSVIIKMALQYPLVSSLYENYHYKHDVRCIWQSKPHKSVYTFMYQNHYVKKWSYNFDGEACQPQKTMAIVILSLCPSLDARRVQRFYVTYLLLFSSHKVILWIQTQHIN